jgi:hypothetical protein
VTEVVGTVFFGRIFLTISPLLFRPHAADMKKEKKPLIKMPHSLIPIPFPQPPLRFPPKKINELKKNLLPQSCKTHLDP